MPFRGHVNKALDFLLKTPGAGENIITIATAGVVGLTILAASGLGVQDALVIKDSSGNQTGIIRTDGTASFSGALTSNSSGSLVWYRDDVAVVGQKISAQFVAPTTLQPKDVKLRVKNAPTGAALIIDINEAGTSLFSTRPEIDATAVVEDGNHVFSDTSIAKGALVTVDIDQIGSTLAGSGLTVILEVIRQ